MILTMTQSNRIVLASVGDDKVNLSPLTDFVINFDDRQQLKIIEDQVLDLQVILPGILDAVEEIREEFKSFRCPSMQLKGDELEEFCAIVDEFDEYGREVKMMMERSKALNDMAISTARLVSFRSSGGETESIRDTS
jgi:hypothetical protein